MSLEDRIDIVKTMWRIVYSDGRLTDYENYLVRKLSDLLGLEHHVMIDAKVACCANWDWLRLEREADHLVEQPRADVRVPLRLARRDFAEVETDDALSVAREIARSSPIASFHDRPPGTGVPVRGQSVGSSPSMSQER